MVRLELYHPEVAFRNCNHCRKFFYDDKTGKPREDRNKQLLPRLKETTLPCVNGEGCPKGHYSKPLKLSPEERQIVDLYGMVRATGGMCLTEAERNDSITTYSLSLIDSEYRRFESQETARNIAGVVIAFGRKA